MARGGVHDDARVFVIAHEFRHGDLAGEVVHDSQIFISGVKLGLEIGGDGFASGAGVARLAHQAATAYSFAMSTISVSDLQKKPAKQWLKSASKDDLVITSKGQPIAVLLRIASASVESTRALVRSVRALQAQTALQQAAVGNGTADFSMSDIDAESAASRRARRRK